MVKGLVFPELHSPPYRDFRINYEDFYVRMSKKVSSKIGWTVEPVFSTPLGVKI